MTEAPLIADRNATGEIVTIQFNRPRKRNALSFEALRALHAELRKLANDDVARFLVLRGSEHPFCAGLDLREALDGEPITRECLSEFNLDVFQAEPEHVERGRVMPRLVQEAIKRIKLLPQIVVGLAEGAACGGGAGLLSGCDYVIGVKGFRFAFTETKRGIYPTLLFPFLRRKFPIAALLELVLTARVGDVELAKEIGLIQRVANAGDADQALEETLELLAANEPDSLRVAKRLFAEQTLPSDDEINEGWEGHCRSWNAESCRKRVRDFLEKRA